MFKLAYKKFLDRLPLKGVFYIIHKHEATNLMNINIFSFLLLHRNNSAISLKES